MKSMKSTLLAFFAMTLITVSCKKDSTSSSNLAAGKCQISCNVSGATSASFSSSTLVSTAISSGSIYNISGGTTTIPVQLMMFILPASITTGTYHFNSGSSSIMSVSYSNSSGSGWAAAMGSTDDFTLNITKATGTELEGTFNGTLTNDSDHTTITVTNGRIAAKF